MGLLLAPTGAALPTVFAGRQGQVPTEAEHQARQQQEARRQTVLTLLRHTVEAAGDRWRPDLVTLLQDAQDPDHPWRQGSVDAVIERQGKLHGVVCQLPPGEPGSEGWASVADAQAVAQAHHEGLLARAVGLNLDHWERVQWDPGTWHVLATPVAWDEPLAQQLTLAGDQAWAHALAGTLPASVSPIKMPGEWPAAHWETLSAQYLAYTLLNRQSEAFRDQLGATLQTLSADQFPLDVDQVSLGPARVRVERVFQEDKVLAVARQLLADAGHDDDAIQQVLGNPNLTTPAQYDVDRLIDLVNMWHNCDVRTDERYQDAIREPARPNVKTLLAFIAEMDGERTVDYGALVDPARSSVRLEMPRGAVSGPQAQARERLLAQVAPRLTELAREMAQTYPQALAQALEDTPVAPAPKRRRTPG